MVQTDKNSVNHVVLVQKLIKRIWLHRLRVGRRRCDKKKKNDDSLRKQVDLSGNNEVYFNHLVN